VSYEPLHHKYRPKTFAELVGQEAIATTLTNAIHSERIAPAYLFTGPRGTGKTSSARILAKSLNCKKQDKPTEAPCGVCDVCKSIASGSAVDVIEIDAASNTGVDNIRELIEKAQFAPIQCRYKVYVIDECLTGDSLVQTSEGLMRIDEPTLKGKKVLSYNESLGVWEFKTVLRWLDQGVRETFVIKTTNCEIRCTGNHLIRTEAGWIAAKNVKEGMKILSPVNVDAAPSFTDTGQMDACGDLSQVINSREIHTDKNPTIWPLFLNKLKPSDPSVLADVESNWISQRFYNRKAKEFKVFSHTGKNILTKKDTDSGIVAHKRLSPTLGFCNPTHLGLSMEPCLEMAALPTQTHIVDFPDCVGRMEIGNGNGWNIKPLVLENCDPHYELHLAKGTEISQSVAIRPVILNSKMSLTLLNHREIGNSSLQTGSIELPQKDWLGGTWMMAPSVSAQKEAHQFNYIQRDTPQKKIKSLPIGLHTWVTQQQQNLTKEAPQVRFITTPVWEQKPVGNGWQTCKSIQFPQWITNLERVESVRVAGVERVYDIEVEDNHNFVANELLVHNCHMLSTAAFNALLKTLEEPPARIVFVLATTDPQRVLPTIISRCQRFDFRRIPLEAMVQHLQDIASKETINITADALTLVAQVAQGGLRDAESLLDQLSLLPGQVTVEQVWDLVGAVPERDLMALTEAIASNDPQAVLDKCRRLMDKGREPLVVLQNLAGFYRDLLIAKTAPTRSDLVAVTSPTWNQLCKFTEKLDVSSIFQGQQHLKNSETQIKNTTQPRLWLEVTLLGLLPSALSANIVAINEDKIHSGIAFKPSINNRSQSSVSDREVLAKQGIAQRPPSAFKQIGEHHPTEPLSHSTAQPLDANGGAVNQPQTTPANPVSQASAISRRPPSGERADDSTTAASSYSNSTPASDIERSSNAQEDINQIWQQVLEHLQPRATRELLRQHCRLVAFDRSTARIGISSEPLLKMAQTRVANIEAAFEVVYKTKVKVSLQTNSSESFTTAPARTLTTSTQQSSEEVVTPAATNYPPTLPVRQEPPEIKDEPRRQGERENVVPFSRRSDNSITSTPVSDDSDSPQNAHRLNSEAPLAYAQTRVPAVQRDQVTSTELQRDVASVSLTQSPSSIPTQDLDWDAEEVEMALGNLKQFFEGEIVDLTDDFEPNESLITEDTPEVATVTLSEQSSNAVSDQLEDELTQGLDFLEPAPSSYQPLSDTTNSSNSSELLELEDFSDNDDDIPF
jgi:DNA polymerase-3 subunit gamma/tau